MILLISPAKSMNPSVKMRGLSSAPQFIAEATELMTILKTFDAHRISHLMKISDKLAQENHHRYQSWQSDHTAVSAKIASLLFQGGVYKGLDAMSFSDLDFDFAQKHLRILSGLYGILRPLDRIFPYRLEMGTKLTNPKGKNLYEFWDAKIAENINQELQHHADQTLINLASNEYFKVVNKKNIRYKVITPVFKDYKNGEYKVISFYAKKARGLMASFMIKNRIEENRYLQAFDAEGYQFSAENSSEQEWVFLRER